MEEERDLVTFETDDGEEFDLEVLDYFDYEGQEYAVLAQLEEDVAEDADTEVYIMKVTVEGEDEVFLPADEDKMDALTEIVEGMIKEWECGGDCGACDKTDCSDRE